MFFCPIPCQRICMKVSDRARIITKAEVSRLLSRAGSVVGRSLRILIRLQLGVPTHRCPRLRVPEIWEKQQGVRSRHPLHWPPSCTADANRVPNLPLLKSWTGGFAAGVGPGSVLAKYRPDLVNLPTASAEHCTGDGLKLGPSADQSPAPTFGCSLPSDVLRVLDPSAGWRNEGVLGEH